MVIKQVSLSWISNALAFLILLLRIPLLYDLLGDKVNQWFLYVSLLGYIVVLEGGLTQIASRYIGREIGKNDLSYASYFNYLNRRWSIYYAIIGTIAFYSYLIFIGVDNQEYLLLYMTILGISVAINLRYSIWSSLISANSFTGINSIIDCLSSIFYILILFLIKQNNIFIDNIIFVLCLMEFARNILSILLRRNFVIQFLRLNLSVKYKNIDEKGINNSIYNTALSNVAILLYGFIDILIYNYFFKDNNFANYINTQNIIAYISAQMIVISTATLPILLKLSSSNKNKLIEIFQMNILYSNYIFSIIGGFLILYGYELFEIWIGNTYYISKYLIFYFVIYYYFEIISSAWINLNYINEKVNFYKVYLVSIFLRLILILLILNFYSPNLEMIILTKLISYAFIVVPYFIYSNCVGSDIKYKYYTRLLILYIPYFTYILIIYLISMYFDNIVVKFIVLVTLTIAISLIANVQRKLILKNQVLPT